MKKLTVRDITLVGLFVACSAIGAFVRIPIPYVPLSLQDVFALLAGLLLGARLGMISQVIYVALGLIGLPIFTNGGGIAYVLQPSFGYLIGFIFCAGIVGWVIKKMNNTKMRTIMLASLAGFAVVYACGTPYLYFIHNMYLGNARTFGWALMVGTVAFLPACAIKVTIISLFGGRLMRAIKRPAV